MHRMPLASFIAPSSLVGSQLSAGYYTFPQSNPLGQCLGPSLRSSPVQPPRGESSSDSARAAGDGPLLQCHSRPMFGRRRQGLPFVSL